MERFKNSMVVVAMLIGLAWAFTASGAAAKIEENYNSGAYKSALQGDNEPNSVLPSDAENIEPVNMPKQFPVGENIAMQKLPLEPGRVSYFGGPHDKYDRHTRTALGRMSRDLRPNQELYCAFRFPTRMSRAKLKQGYVEFYNPDNGQSVKAKIVDWGPHEKTGRHYDLSKLALERLGAKTDDTVQATLVIPL